MRLGRLVLVVALAAAGILVPGRARAEELTWSVRPTPSDAAPERPHFVYDVSPGQRVEDSIRVRNFGTAPLPLAVYAGDALTTANGALDLRPAGTPATDVGLWTVLGTAEITVPPSGFVDVPFTMTVPADAEAGDHTGGIVTSVRSAGADGVVVDRRLGSRMYVRVAGGLRPSLTVSGVRAVYTVNVDPRKPGHLRVVYTVTNTGNVRLGASQEILATGRRTTPDPMPELLPKNSLTYEVLVEDVWPTVRTTAEVRLRPVPTRPGDTFTAAPAVATAATWSIPWPQLAVLLPAVLGALWLRRRWLRRRRARSAEAPTGTSAA
ncbi:WxL protein peptidoglycan domain-containing protein [Catenuloplanes japonicus]|uniref:WxL protein peptidoglycan domain-containing protein n=1 Tax=Catenuloplanes japonicus TaxID=33876 RepID=UPI00068921FF|nr:DUF916 domain-containing protein [Catenuloplanes japonicus]